MYIEAFNSHVSQSFCLCDANIAIVLVTKTANMATTFYEKQKNYLYDSLTVFNARCLEDFEINYLLKIEKKLFNIILCHSIEPVIKNLSINSIYWL